MCHPKGKVFCAYTGIHFAHFGTKSGMVSERTKAYERHVIDSIPNE